MMNAIAVGVVAYLLANYLSYRTSETDLILKTRELEPSGQLPSLNRLVHAVGIDTPAGTNLHGFIVVAVLLGVGYYVLVWRTRFGYDLRASGINPSAAQASGVNPKRMVVYTMLLSGAIAGMIGMSPLLGFFHQYNQDFPTGLGFTGIAVALVGRNHPVGAAIGALLFAFLDRSAQVLDLIEIPAEVVVITQGVIILSVVVSYAVVERIVRAQQVRVAARETGLLQEAPA
jgi:simple sugar transport system permease protein